MKKLAIAISIVLGAIFATLLLIEISFQFLSRKVIEDITPNLDASLLSEADYVIVCFGDSLTQGVGASSPKFSYPAQLEDILKHKYPDKKIVVLNEGVAGSNSSELILRMRERLPLYPRPPDLIIVITFANNSWNLHQCSALLEGYASLPTSKRWLAKLEQAKVGKLAVILNLRGKALANRLAKTDREKWYADWTSKKLVLLDWSNEEEFAFVQKWIRHDMEKIVELAQSYGSKLLFGNYHTPEDDAIIRKATSNLSFPICDPPPNPNIWKEQGLLAQDGFHLNDKGYALFAEHIADCMEKHGFIPH